jgi:hypothetical protein
MSEVIANTLVTKLTEGAVSFQYRKANGELRAATGTLNADLIPESDRASIPAANEGEAVTYFDLDSKGWRRFNRSAVVAA